MENGRWHSVEVILDAGYWIPDGKRGKTLRLWKFVTERAPGAPIISSLIIPQSFSFRHIVLDKEILKRAQDNRGVYFFKGTRLSIIWSTILYSLASSAERK